MSGGTRCNLTHDTDWCGIADAFGSYQARFLKFSLASLPPDQVINTFKGLGIETKIESTGKVFPCSDKAIDVRDALVNAARGAGSTITNECTVTAIESNKSGFEVMTSQGILRSESVIVTCGGQSYPGCGTTGDGYQWLSLLGHNIVSPRPALAPISLTDQWIRDLKGITIEDVGISVAMKDGTLLSNPRSSDRGSFLLTHFGVSGPTAMNISRAVTDPKNNFVKSLVCDWQPAIGREQMRDQLRAWQRDSGKQSLLQILSHHLPRRLAEAICKQANIDSATRMAELNKSSVSQLLNWLKSTTCTIDGTLGFRKAEVTAGGVDLSEVNAKTMESKIVPGLFLAGEILDVDGPIGGYNFQAAFSTGFVAGLNA